MSDIAALCGPLVPVTLRLRELAVTAFNPLTVSEALFPGEIEAGLNEQRAGPAPEQARLMTLLKPDGASAEIVNCAQSTPRTTTAEPLAAVS